MAISSETALLRGRTPKREERGGAIPTRRAIPRRAAHILLLSVEARTHTASFREGAQSYYAVQSAREHAA